MLNLNPTTLQAVADKALVDAAAHPRWIHAIGRALVELDSNPWIERGELHGLIIASPSGNLYSANGDCQCTAHTYGRACWHRAAARLVRLHDEMQARVCEQPDNICSVEEPCAEHAAAAAAYRAADVAYTQAADAGAFGPLNLPDDDQYDAPRQPMGQRLAAARKALELVNELF